MSDDVVVLAWPEQAAEAERLRGMGVPRLLLVSADGDPPRGIGHLADWVRVPGVLGLEVVSVRGEGVVLQPGAGPGARMSPLKRAAGG